MKSALSVLGIWGGGMAVAIVCFWLLAGVATGSRAPSTNAASAQVASATPPPGAAARTPTIAEAPAAAPPTIGAPTAQPTAAPTTPPTAVPTLPPAPTPTLAPAAPPTAAPTLAPTKPAPAATHTLPVQATATYGPAEQPAPERLAASPAAYVGHRVIVNGAVDRCTQEAGRYLCWMQIPSSTTGRAYYVGVEFGAAPAGVQPGVGLAVTGTVTGTEQAPGGANAPPAAVVRAEQFAVGN